MGLKRRVESLIIDAIFLAAPGLGEEEAEVLIGFLDDKGVDIPLSEDALNDLGLREIHLHALAGLPTHKKIVAALFAIPVGFEFEYVDAVGDAIGTLTLGKFGFDMETWLFGSLQDDQGKNKWNHNGQTIVADGGRNMDNRRDEISNSRASGMTGPDRGTTWSDIRRENNGDGFSIPVSGSTFLSILKVTAVISLFGIVGFGILSVGGYASGITTVAGDYLGANVDGPSFEGITFMGAQALQTVSCFGDAGCIREWQLNNTRRPGSEDVGETYKLNIKNFQVSGSGSGVDVAYQQPDNSVPVYFLVQNTRQGLKGIEARDVQYRVTVRDEGLAGSQDYCSTEWLPLGDTASSENNLVPGEAAEPVNWQDQLTLRECGMLQPGPGNFLNFVLQVKYDYSSQSTLYVDAMSQEHRRSQEIPIDFTRSETADTPVETFIETRSPILFAENGNERTPIPFTARVGVHTDERNLDYRINSSGFTFEDSGITVHDTESCQGLTPAEGENRYELSQDRRDSIQQRQIEENQWFNYQSPPPPASCTMEISEEELNSVSRTGETLTMSADVNYTVRLEETEESFQILNSRCATINCPTVVPLRGSEISSEVININLDNEDPEYTQNANYGKKQYAYCGTSNQDDPDGCTVIEGFGLDQRATQIPEEDPVTINEGDIAVDLSTISNSPEVSIHCDSSNPGEIASVNEDELQQAVNANYALSLNGDEWEAERRGCGSDSNSNGSSSSESSNACDYSTRTSVTGQETYDEAAGCNCEGQWTGPGATKTCTEG